MQPSGSSQPNPQGKFLSWNVQDYSVKVKGGKKQILRDVWGFARPGKMLAVMGPSGSGKTTLLNILTGRVTQGYEGEVNVNGKPIGRDMRHVSGFVPQDDALLGFLTVEENIKFSAKLRIPRNTKPINESVEKVLLAMGLSGIKNRRIGTPLTKGVSGGEKRRTSVGVEMVTGDPILFLDEPTSGLDAASAFNIVTQLKRYCADEAVTVVCTIHQPSTEIYSLFDDLLLLAYGRVVYFGDRQMALGHFENLGKPIPKYTNPADHFLDLVNADFAEDKEAAKKEIQEFTDRSQALLDGTAGREGSGGGTGTTPPNHKKSEFSELHMGSFDEGRNSSQSTSQMKRYPNNILTQTSILLHRGLVNATRNVILYWVRVAMYIAMAVMMGTVWLDVGHDYRSIQDRLGAHFFAVAFLCFMSVAGVPGFLEEKQVFDREYDSGSYSAIAYVLALSLVSIPFIIIIGFSFAIIAYPLIGLTGGVDHFIVYLLVLILALYVAESLVLCVTGWVPIFVVALTLVAFANGFFMAMEGFFVRFDPMPKFWLWGHYLSYQKYAFEAIAKNDIDGVTFNCVTNPAGVQQVTNSSLPAQCQSTGFTCSPYVDELNPTGSFHGRTALEYWIYSYEDVNVTIWCFCLVGLILIFRFFFWLSLWWKKKHQ